MRPCFTILVHLLLCLPIWAIGQNGKIDSLKRVIETTKVDTVRGRTLCRLCDELRKVGKYEVALATGERGLEGVRNAKDRTGEGDCHNTIGALYHTQGDYARALESYHRSLKIVEKLGNPAFVARSLTTSASSMLSKATLLAPSNSTSAASQS